METVAEIVNGYALDPSSSISVYPPRAEVYKTAESKTASSGRFQYVDTYMDDLLHASQGNPTQQQRFSGIKTCALKEIFSSIPDELKGSASLKKALAGDGNWGMFKEILGWEIDTHQINLALSYKQQL